MIASILCRLSPSSTHEPTVVAVGASNRAQAPRVEKSGLSLIEEGLGRDFGKTRIHTHTYTTTNLTHRENK